MVQREEIDVTENFKKVKDLLSFYFERQTEIYVLNNSNKSLVISGKVEELTRKFFGKWYVVIGGMKLFLEDIDAANIYPVGTEVKEEEVEGGFERKSIPKSVKVAVWERYFGKQLRGKCMCCGVTEITRDECEMCHIIAVANGGENSVDNLKPGCKNCNRSMGTQDFNEYKREYH